MLGIEMQNPSSDFSGRGTIRDCGVVLPYFVTGVNTDYLNYFAKLTIRQNRVSTSPNASRAAIPNPAGSQ